MDGKTKYYLRNREKLLNQAKEYYKNNKERLWEQASNKYRELSDEKKKIQREYGRNKYQNISEENKQILKQYQKSYCEAKKNQLKTFFISFSLHGIKIEQKVLIFDKKCINKNVFHKIKRPININNVEIRRIVLSKKDSYGKKGSFKYFIGYINELMLFQYHYA